MFETELADYVFAKKEEDLLKEKAQLSVAENKASFLQQELIDQLTAMAEKEQQMQLALATEGRSAQRELD